MWEDIIVEGIFGDALIKFTLEDENGNKAEIPKAISIPLDITPPVAARIYNNNFGPTDVKMYLKPGQNTIALELEESGSGFYKKNAYLDLGYLGGEVKKKADQCIKEGLKWICLFDANVRNPGKIIVLQATKDDADNTLEAPVGFDAVISDSKPKITEIKISNDCPYSGELVTIEVNTEGDLPVRANVDLSKVSQRGKVEMICLERCEIDISEFYSTPMTSEIIFNVTDASGNSNIFPKKFSICEPDLNRVPNFISISTGTLPAIDRRTLSLTSLPIQIPINANLRGASINKREISCTNTDRSYFTGEMNSLDFIAVVSKEGDPNASLTLSCTTTLWVRSGLRSFANPEKDNFTFTLPSFNNPLGTLDQNIQDRLDSVQHDIDSLGKAIKKWEKWNKWLSMICSVVESLGKLNAVVGILKGVLHVVALILYSIPITKGLGEGLWNLICSVSSWIDVWITDVVWSPGYAINFGTLFKSICIIYTCKICTMDYADAYANLLGIDSTVVGVVAGAGVYGAIAQTNKWVEGDGKPTILGNWIGAKLDPYKSIHAARSCLCIPAIIYNMKKEQQIKCMYKSCVQKNAEAGLPISTCALSYKERQCLYVDGAQWKLVASDEFLQFLANLISLMIRNLPVIAGSIVWIETCYPSYKSTEYIDACASPPDVKSAFHNSLCHLLGSSLTIGEQGDLFSFDISKYEPSLGGTNYCSSSG